MSESLFKKTFSASTLSLEIIDVKAATGAVLY